MLTDTYLINLNAEDLTETICEKILDGGMEKINLLQPETRDRLEQWFSVKSAEEQIRTTTKDGKIIPKKKSKISVISAKELMEKDIPELKWLVDDLLPEQSVSLVVAPPKSYKSFLCIDLCLAIADGRTFLSKQCRKHDVLYLDLESTERRPRDRIRIVSGGEKPPNNFYIFTAGEMEVGQIGNGFEESIKQIFADHKDIALVIVDVFQYIRQRHSKAQNAYDSDYEDLKVIKQLAKVYNTAFLLVHHSRKMKDPQDVFNNVSGSSGLFGAVDCMIMIDKDKREDEFATFYFTGRDIESMEVRMRFDKTTCKWQYIGEKTELILQEREKEYNESPVITSIKKELEHNNGTWTGTLSDLKHDSKYFQCNIHDDVRVIAKKIKDYRDLLLKDNISFVIDRGHDHNRRRVYKFSNI